MSEIEERYPPQGIPAGGAVHALRYLYPIGINPARGTQTGSTAYVYIRPLTVPFDMTLDRLGCVTSISAGNFRMGIYSDNGGTPAGGALIVETASIAFALGVNEVAIIPTLLTAGLYWIALIFDGLVVSLYRSTGSGTPVTYAGGTLRVSGYARAGGYGALTDPCPAVGAANREYVMYARVASVP